MGINKILLTLVLFNSIACTAQMKSNYTPKEISCLKVFNEFTGHIKNLINNNEDIDNTSELKYILLNYLFVNSKLDSSKTSEIASNELSADQLNSLKKQLKTFFKFLQEREDKNLAENLTSVPFRLSNDKSIYNNLSSFQKENTFIFFDKRYPKKTLGYILFVPALNKIVSTPRIWSWTLTYQYGRYMFKSVTGEEGYEFIFTPDEKGK